MLICDALCKLRRSVNTTETLLKAPSAYALSCCTVQANIVACRHHLHGTQQRSRAHAIVQQSWAPQSQQKVAAKVNTKFMTAARCDS